MPILQRSALVPHSAENMYRLVSDIDAYPAFLPWCEHARILEQGEHHQLAEVGISKRFQQSTFKTRNRLEPGQAIAMELVQGPFRHLHGTWRFTALDDSACKVELEVDFEFAGGLLAAMLKPVFSRVCDTLVKAFVQRADSVYAGH